MPAMTTQARTAVESLWTDADLDPAAAARLQLPGQEPVLPSSFAVASALQASLGAAALAATEVGVARGAAPQTATVDAADAVREGSAWFRLDGRVPELWDKVSGLYRCGEGHVRIHANFAHHRDGALRLLGLPPGPEAGKAEVGAALQRWRAADFEQAAADAGLVVAALRSFDEWDAHPQAAVVAAQPLVALQRIGNAEPPPWQPLRDDQRPLSGLRVLDLTRILAGPVSGRTLAAYGADVMLVNSPNLPNIEAIADTSRGKLSVHLDLATAAGRERLGQLVRQADVFLQGYRPGALARLGFGAEELIKLNPSLVMLSLSAYGDGGPWGGRRGFDSLVQTATGFNHAEAQALGAAEPRALPLQVLDYSAGFLLAFGAQAALLRRAREGGAWQARVTLARTGLWLRGLGRLEGVAGVVRPALDAALEATDSGFGRLEAVCHAARFSRTPAQWARPSMPPGSHPAEWPAR